MWTLALQEMEREQVLTALAQCPQMESPTNSASSLGSRFRIRCVASAVQAIGANVMLRRVLGLGGRGEQAGIVSFASEHLSRNV